MAAFFIATTKVKNPDKFQTYAQKAGASIAQYDGEMVLRGKSVNVLSGHSDPNAVGIVRFADTDALERWYNSADYQQLIPLRNEAADMTLVTYEEPA